MSQTIKKKSSTSLPVTELETELSSADKIGQWLYQYGSMAALVAALGFLIFVAMVWLIKSNQTRQEAQWIQLNQSIAEVGLTGKSDGLLDVADEFPDGKAGMWALQLAGDYDLQTGLQQINQNRDQGTKRIKKAINSLQRIVDAPDSQKTPLLQRRSTFSLAYALESLGEFEKSKKYYQALVEAAPDSSFAQAAQRGLKRTSEPAYVALYEKFKTAETELKEAPGPLVPDRPNISFPELDDSDSADKSADESNDFQTEPDDTSSPATESVEPSPGDQPQADGSESENGSSENTEADETDSSTDQPSDSTQESDSNSEGPSSK